MSGGRKPMQDYSALYEYMTADDWEHLRQDGAPFLRNCERVFERAYQLGLRRPTEPTLATMAVIAQGGGATSGFEANQIYLSAKARWRQWFRRREQARIEWEDYPVRLGSEECDRDPCVTAVLTAQPRAACPLDTQSMLSQVAMVPLRSTHATLAPARTVVSPAPPAPYTQLMGMAMQAMAHLQGQGAQGQGQQRAQDANEIPIVHNRRPSSASAGAGLGHRTDSSEQPALPGSAAGQGSQQLALPAAEGQDPQQLALPAPQAEAAAVEEDMQRKFPTAQETGAPQQEGGPKGSAAQQMREALAEHLRNREGKDKAPHPQKRPSAKAATRKKPAASGQETCKKPAASGVGLQAQQAKRGYTTMWYGSAHKCAIRQKGGRQLCQFGQKRYTRQKLEAHAWRVIGQIEAGEIREADVKEACEALRP